MAKEDGDLSYTILLILTAGDVDNVEETKRLLAKASDSPLSVIIVGIGDHDFGRMEYLDEHDPEEGSRDITTFVRFDECQHLNSLTEAVLDKMPDQLVDFFVQRKIMPGQASDMDTTTVEVMSADDDDRTVNFLG
jgi:Copine